MARRVIFRGFIFAGTLLIGVALLAFLVWGEGIDSVVDSLMTFGALPFAGFVIFSALNFILYSWRWQMIINSHLPKSQRMPLYKVYLHRMSGYAVSYLTPAAQVGGEPVRMAMLTTDKVPIKESTSSVVLDIAFELAAYVIFIIAGVALALWQGLGGTGSYLIIIVGLSVVLFTLIVFFSAIACGKGFFSRLSHFFKLHKIKKLHRVDRGIHQTEKLMTDFLAGKPWRLILISAISLIVIAFRIVEVFYIAYFFGVSLNFAQAFLTATLPGIALLLPVPAGLGLFEGGFGAVFGLLGIPLSAVAFALVIRMRDAVFIFVGVTHILGKGKHFIEKRLLKK